MIIRRSHYILIVTALLLAFFTQVDGQRWKLQRYEACFGLGTAHFFGDIGGTADKANLYGLKDIRFNETRPSAYLGARYRFLNTISGKFNIIYGNVTSHDIGSRNEPRGLTFSASLLETSVQGEYYFIPETRRIRRTSSMLNKGRMNNFNTISAYVFGGFGSILFFPKVKGRLDLQKPEEISRYGKIALTIPAGIGLKYSLDNYWAFGLEMGGRWNSTDYIDGFKSEFSNFNDIYYFTSIQAIRKIKNNRDNMPKFLKKRGYGASSSKARKPKKYKKPKKPKPPGRKKFLFF